MSNPLTAAQLADSPVGLWVLDEGAGATVAVNQGSSGAAFNGTIGVNVTMGVPGCMAGTTAAQFSGAGADDSYAIRAQRDPGNVHGMEPTDNVTFEYVVNVLGDSAGMLAATPFYFGGMSSPDGYGSVYSLSDPNDIDVEFNDNNFTNPVASGGLTLTQKPFIVTARYGNNLASIWINGVKQSEVPSVPPIVYDDATHPDNGVQIGGLSNNFCINGIMQNVAVYDTALSDDRIVAHATLAGLMGQQGPFAVGGAPLPNNVAQKAMFKPILVRRTKSGFIVFG